MARTPTLTGYGEIFIVAAGSEMLGGGVVFAILNALFFKQRAITLPRHLHQHAEIGL